MQLTTKLEKQIERFVKSNFKFGYFTKDIYTYLHVYHNGFIAHFNREGFYANRFKNVFDRLQTLKKISEKKNDPIAAYFTKCLDSAKEVRSKIHHENIARNYADSFATALRNAVDPKDPAQKEYSEQLHVRLQDLLVYAAEHNVDMAAIQQYIINAVKHELSWLTSGALDNLRASMRNK